MREAEEDGIGSAKEVLVGHRTLQEPHMSIVWLASVVLPEPVPPEMTTLSRDSIALRIMFAWRAVMTLEDT